MALFRRVPEDVWKHIDDCFNHSERTLVPAAVGIPSGGGTWIERFMDKEWVAWEWKVQVVGQRWRKLLNDAICENWPHFLHYLYSDTQRIEFPISAALRLAAGQTVTQDVIDFCLSPRGLLLQPKREYLAYPYAATEIRSKVLTVAEGQAWFFRRAEERRGLIRRIEPWRYDYVFVPFVMKTRLLDPEWQDHSATDWHGPQDQCYFIIICGLNGRIAKRVFWADPQTDEHFCSYTNGGPPSRRSAENSTALLTQILHCLVLSIRLNFPLGFKRYKAAESSFEKILLPIEASKCSNGNGIALSLALVRIIQQPHRFFKRFLASRNLARRPSQDAEFVLYPESLDGVNVAQGILITFIQMLRVIDRRPHIPPEARTLALNGFGIPPSVKEVELHVRLFPQGIMAWWRVWLDAEAKGFPEALFYMIYKERINVRLPPPTLRVTRLRGSTTGEDI